MTHPMTSATAAKLLSVAWPGIALYGLVLGVMIWAAIDHWRRRIVTWRGQGRAMTPPRRTVPERLGLPD